jgi:hypothetical protein
LTRFSSATLVDRWNVVKEVLGKVIDVVAQKFGAEYVEACAQGLFRTLLTLKEGRVEAAKRAIESGVAVLVENIKVIGK